MEPRPYYCENTLPILYHSDVRKHIRYVIYGAKNKSRYGTSNIVSMISDKEISDKEILIKSSFNFDIYAIGIVINLFRTNILALDFDNYSEEEMLRITDCFLTYHVVALDLYRSSTKGYHLYIKYKDFYDMHNVLSHSLIENFACPGFVRLALKKHEIVLRISKKYMVHHGKLMSVIHEPQILFMKRDGNTIIEDVNTKPIINKEVFRLRRFNNIPPTNKYSLKIPKTEFEF